MNNFNGLIGIVILVLDIIALIDIFKSGMSTTEKVLWALAVLLFPLIGMILYFLLGKKGMPSL
jgi:succinate dehydrogenase/fumarate reductase cytochrome b subunit